MPVLGQILAAPVDAERAAARTCCWEVSAGGAVKRRSGV